MPRLDVAFLLQEKIVAGNQILITLSTESLESSSLSTQQGGVVSAYDASSARTISSAKDHYGTGRQRFVYDTMML